MPRLPPVDIRRARGHLSAASLPSRAAMSKRDGLTWACRALGRARGRDALRSARSITTSVARLRILRAEASRAAARARVSTRPRLDIVA